MKFFGGRRSTEDTHVRNIRAVRAMYIGPDQQEVNVTFRNEANDILTLRLTPQQTYTLINELQAAYEAINPPLRRSDQFSQWDGMS